MDIQSILGNDFKDGMSIEEINAALANKKLVDLSAGGYVSKEKFDAISKEYAKSTSELKKIKESTLTEEQKREEASKAQLEEIASLKRNLSKSQAEAVFKGVGLTEEEYSSFIDACICEDGEKTKELATNIANLIKSRVDKTKEETEKETLAKALKDSTIPNGGDGGKKGTATIIDRMFKDKGIKTAESIKDLYKSN